MNAPMTSGSVHPAVLLLELGHRARQAQTVQELEFLLVNDTRLLLPYRQAVWWTQEGGVQTLSGVVQPDANAPYAQWVVQVCRHMAQHQPRLGAFTAADVPPELAAQWSQWWPAHAVWLPMSQATPGTPGSTQGEAASAGLLLVGAEPFPADRLPVLGEWCSMWGHLRGHQRTRGIYVNPRTSWHSAGRAHPRRSVGGRPDRDQCAPVVGWSFPNGLRVRRHAILVGSNAHHRLTQRIRLSSPASPADAACTERQVDCRRP